MTKKKRGPDMDPAFMKECLCGGHNLHFKIVIVSAPEEEYVVRSYVFGGIGGGGGESGPVYPGKSRLQNLKGGGVETHFHCEQCCGTYIENQTFHEGCIYVRRALLKN